LRRRLSRTSASFANKPAAYPPRADSTLLYGWWGTSPRRGNTSTLHIATIGPVLRPVFLTIALVLFSLLNGCSRALVDPPTDTPAKIVEKLYRVRIEGKMTGAPTAEELAKLAPYLSTDLRTLLEKARQLHDAEAKKFPDEKPPFTEGDLFTSLFEGPTTAQVGTQEPAGAGYRVKVQFTYSGAPPSTNWTDTVWLVQENNGYKISDVEYGGAGEFGNHGTLIANLKSGLAEGAAAP